MNNLPLHAALVHLPVAVAVALPLVAAAAAWAWRTGRLPRQVWLLAVLVQLLLTLGAQASMWSGEREEDAVEEVVGHDAIEHHEERAEAFTTAAWCALLLALAAAAWPKEPVALRLALATVAASLLVAGLGLATGHAGGELVYEHGAAAACGPSGASGDAPSRPARRPNDEEDDD